MNKSIEKVTTAFVSGAYVKNGNGLTDGRNLYLFGNKIAEHREDGLYITNCGWESRTTKNWLNGLPDINVCQRKKQWYLNGELWDGQWIKVNSNTPPELKDAEKYKKVYDLTSEWVSSDGWRGTNQPKYAICGANDTGMWSDSPCPSDVSKSELSEAISLLKKAKIPSKIISMESSNVFMRSNYVIVPPYYFNDAQKFISENFDVNSKRLTYLCN